MPGISCLLTSLWKRGKSFFTRIETAAEEFSSAVCDADDHELFIDFKNIKLLFHLAPPKCWS